MLWGESFLAKLLNDSNISITSDSSTTSESDDYSDDIFAACDEHDDYGYNNIDELHDWV